MSQSYFKRHICFIFSRLGLKNKLLLGVFLASLSSTCLAIDWVASLAPPPTGISFEPQEQLRIILPANFPSTALEYIALELDNKDVSALVQITNNQLIIRPPQPLSDGTHQLHLVEYDNQQGFVERGRWSFQVQKSSNKNLQYNLSGNLTIIDRFRLASGDTSAGQAKGNDNHLTGSATLAAEVGTPDWRLTANANVNGDNNGVSTSDPDDHNVIELGEYVVAGVTEGVTGIVGHHNLGQSNLIINSFQRRGVSLTFSEDNRYSATGFSMRTEPITGISHIFGVEQKQQRIDGAFAQINPLTDSPQALSISATYITGAGNNSIGTATSGASNSQSGYTWGGGVRSSLFDQRLLLSAEFAQSSTDFDGLGGNNDSVSDEAYNLSAGYHLFRNEKLFGTPVNWYWQFDHKMVGTQYRSLANAGEIADRRIYSLTSSLQGSNWNINATAVKQTTNVHNSSELPRYILDTGQLSINYSPIISTGIRNWLGQPTITAAVDYASTELDDNPLKQDNLDADNSNQQYRVGVTFAHPQWSWNFGHSTAITGDHVTNSSNLRSETSNLGVQMQFKDQQYIGASLQRFWRRNRESGLRSTDYNLNLNAGFVLLKDIVDGSTAVSFIKNDNSDGSVESLTSNLNLNLNWHLYKAANNKNAIDAFLEATYQNIDDEVTSASNRTQYFVFVGLKVGLGI